MGKTLEGRVKLKRDTSANWTANNPVILNGELILVDTAEGELRAKIGDGTKTYTQLPFSDEILRNLINNKVSSTDMQDYVSSIIAASIPTPTDEDENKHIVVLNGQYTLQTQSGGGQVTLVHWTEADIGG